MALRTFFRRMNNILSREGKKNLVNEIFFDIRNVLVYGIVLLSGNAFISIVMITSDHIHLCGN